MTPTVEKDALARALYEQQGRRNIREGLASFHPASWDDLPEGSRDYWRGQAAELIPTVEKDAGRPCAFFPPCPSDDGYVCAACRDAGRVIPPDQS